MNKLSENRKLFLKVKPLPFWGRWKCKHDYVYLGIDNQHKLYGCLKCGKIDS